MKIILKSGFSFFLIFGLLFIVKGQGYEIKLRINGLSDTTVILGHYFDKSMYPDDTVMLNKKGVGIFKGQNSLPGGMYIIFLPSTKFFEILISDDQKFSIEADTVNFVDNIKIEGSDENSIFLNFQKYMKSIKLRADSIQKLINNTDDEKKKAIYHKQLQEINTNRIKHTNDIVEENTGSFVSKFLKATLEIVVPDPPKDKDGNIIDSTWQYYYYRNHYFDNFDISDARLLRTPIYEDKIMNYMTKVIPQIPDSIIPEIDMLIGKSHADSILFRYMLITLFNYYGKSKIMGMDAVQVHIADKYYINESWWSDPKFIKDLKDKVEKIKPLLIGEKALDIELVNVPSQHFIEAKNDTSLKRFPHIGIHFKLYDVKAEYTILLFWEADCGHCKTVVPDMYKIYQNSLKNQNVKVVAISTLFGEEGKIKWVDFVNKYGLYDWINAWNPYSYDFKVKYNIMSTPQIFILDADKKIMAKNISPEQTLGILSVINNRPQF
jgi:thiol-disulfide isomerase/thioredoxin